MQYNRFSYIYGILYCSSECGSISITQLRTIYCNTHVHTFHVCLCLLALTFVCNSTYLLKCSFQIYRKSIVVFIRSSKVWFKTTSGVCESLKKTGNGGKSNFWSPPISLGSTKFSKTCIACTTYTKFPYPFNSNTVFIVKDSFVHKSHV